MRGVDETLYAELRPLAFSISYRMLGSASEAEDVVQEAFLRLHRAADEGEVHAPKAYLATVATRLSIDRLRSARARREQYVGTWLPEPIVIDEELEAVTDAEAETADSLSLAFLVLLESLTPVERAVFLLRDVFDLGYAEIAEIVGKREDNVRQIAARARRHVDERRPRFESSGEERERLAERFFAAAQAEDGEELAALLAPDVVFVGDGGGRFPGAILRPVHGRERVVRLLLGFARRPDASGLRLRLAEVNGQAGAVFYAPDGSPYSVLALDVVDGAVTAIRSVVNPDKLRHLRPLDPLADG
ncbi:MAG TPA: RNA polymerase sigma-70 factor [Gaiellaceae bacterium]|nr:RNA polymerase sigma-70 factor [Gaiellaceae bacterium]